MGKLNAAASGNDVSEWKGFLTSPAWIWRHMMLIAFVANLWLNTRYITRDEYVSDRKDVTASLKKIEEVLTSGKLTLTLVEQNLKRVDDHEARIRIIEQRKP